MCHILEHLAQKTGVFFDVIRNKYYESLVVLRVFSTWTGIFITMFRSK